MLALHSCLERSQALLTRCGFRDSKTGKSRASSIILILAVLCAVLPLSINQLTSAILVAVVYALYQEYLGGYGHGQKGSKAVPNSNAPCSNGMKRHTAPSVTTLPRSPDKRLSMPSKLAAVPEHESNRHSAASQRLIRFGYKATDGAPGLELPASLSRPAPGLDLPPRTDQQLPQASASQTAQAPSGSQLPGALQSSSGIADLGMAMPKGFVSEVDALLRVISPTPASDRMVRELTRQVEQTIRPTFPGAEVVGFSTGDLARSTTLGMSTPEVDLVVSVNPDSLPGQLLGRLARTGGASTAKLDARKVQKSAIRACTNVLVSDAGFKFRRSAFRGQDPKITLLAPAPLGKSIIDQSGGIPVDLSVNTATPQCMDAVLKACRRFDPTAQALLVLVRRWARDRGICHSAKGHLSPYAWSLLAAFYLQVAPAGESPSVPPLHGIKLGDSGFTMQQAQTKSASNEWSPDGGVDYGTSKSPQKKSVAALFREFVLFFHKDFNWRSEAVSLRAGKRAAPELALPLHIVVSSMGVPTQVGPHIEDPFEPTTNLGMSMTEEGFARMQEELDRALTILTGSEPSLSELLEPWVVPNSSNDPEGESDLMSSSQTGSICSSELRSRRSDASTVDMSQRGSQAYSRRSSEMCSTASLTSQGRSL